MKTVVIPMDLARMAMQALIYQARNEAGQSQAPDLFIAEETEEYKAAEKIAQCIQRTDMSHARGFVSALENFLTVREEVRQLAAKAELNEASTSHQRYVHAKEVLDRARVELVQSVALFSGASN